MYISLDFILFTLGLGIQSSLLPYGRKVVFTDGLLSLFFPDHVLSTDEQSRLKGAFFNILLKALLRSPLLTRVAPQVRTNIRIKRGKNPS